MFKDVFVLKRKAWYIQLMKWTWGFKHSDFSHVCPLFWLTILNIVIFPIVLFLKALKPIGMALIIVFNKIGDKIEESQNEWVDANYSKVTDVSFQARMIITNPYSEGRWGKLWWKLSANNLALYNELLRKRASLQSDRKFIKYKEKATRKEQINYLVKIAKPVGKIFLFLIMAVTVAFVAYGLYWFAIWIGSGGIARVPWMGIVRVVLTIIAVVIVTGLGAYAAERIKENREKRINKASFNGRILTWPFRMLWTGIIFIFHMIKSSCPAIKWED